MSRSLIEAAFSARFRLNVVTALVPGIDDAKMHSPLRGEAQLGLEAPAPDVTQSPPAGASLFPNRPRQLKSLWRLRPDTVLITRRIRARVRLANTLVG
jgi:hypothetical protein